MVWADTSWIIPLPWLLGSLLTVAELSLCGPSLSTPWDSRQAGQYFLGPRIGLKFILLVALFIADYIGVMLPERAGLHPLVHYSNGYRDGLFLFRARWCHGDVDPGRTL